MRGTGHLIYKIFFTPTAKKDYESVRDAKLTRGINRIIEKLKENPYQFKPLSGPLKGLRSAKTFSFRILYRIVDQQLIVMVITIEHRKQAYR
ncbi:MAG: type II toxin-antitoxin system RelE/ParE family toxin [Candidatus Omnitrophota bacterium]